MATITTSTTNFVRDRFTWLSYFMIAYFAYQQAAIGPLMPFLRDELNMPYSVGSLHLTMLAGGSVIVGIWGRTIIRRVGRANAYWGGGGLMAVGTLIFITGRHPVITILGTFIMGVSGVLMIVILHSGLGDTHGDKRQVAITEANISAAGFGMIAPLLVGISASTVLGWRAALMLAVLTFVAVFLRYRGSVQIPQSPQRPDPTHIVAKTSMPDAYWAYWLFVMVGVSVEWCVNFWGADFLETVVGLPKEHASALMSVYLGAILFSRIIASRLTRRYPLPPLLISAVLLMMVGFPIFWLSPVAPLNALGLFIAGLGIANFFPLGYAAAANIVPDQQDAASTGISLSAGLAIMIMPQVMGMIADQIEIKNAFGIVIPLMVIMFFVTIRANRMVQVIEDPTEGQPHQW